MDGTENWRIYAKQLDYLWNFLMNNLSLNSFYLMSIHSLSCCLQGQLKLFYQNLFFFLINIVRQVDDMILHLTLTIGSFSVVS